VTAQKFDEKTTYTVSMVMRKTTLSRNSIIRAITNLDIPARRSSDRYQAQWLMEGEDLNLWWNSLPTNVTEFVGTTPKQDAQNG
jgi:hypothetical protein